MHYRYLTIEQREILTSLICSQFVPGVQLEIALKRLHAPDYGVCIECDKDIGFVRLSVDPWALHCQACALLPISVSKRQEALV